MRKIKITTWKAKISEDKEVDENLMIAINVLLSNKRPEEMKRGLDFFRTMNRISKAFEKAEESNELVLEESDYSFLKETIEKDVPAVWGMNQKLNEAIELFLNAKQE